MDFQDIPVSAVTVNGVPAESFEQVDATPAFPDPGTQPMKLVINPAGDGIVEGTEMTVVVAYAGTPVEITDADDSLEGWVRACYPLAPPQTCDGAFVVGEPIGAQGWFPSNNFPTDKATFDTSITVPADIEAVGIGELVYNSNNGDGTETWAWSEDDPTSTYLTTATNGNFDYTKRDITESLTGRTLPQYEFIDSSATPAEKTTINTNLGRTEAMTNFLSTRFGPYPYDSGGAVADKAAGVGYALEVATKSHYSGGFTTGAPSISQSTLVHEISHMWMGNAVTLDHWNDIWLQEGWAQWVSWAWNFEDGTSTKSPGEQWSEQYVGPADAKWNTIPTVLNNDPADLFSTFPTYTRGAMTYQGYREIVGSPKFFEFARELQERFAYGNVTTEEVVDLMLEISDFEGDDLALLEDYFDQWLYQAGRPTITPNDFT
jgi:aminopeptidase N